ncbi:hypothetical protein N9Y63_00550 [Akkermansiaceae bacterium]|jgi:hypothetical protein|nr:hypothetical protein [Akkermansiaceae bacterium]MDB2639326.1 hypothetical protein [Akkermansiaceae bacterium]
MSFKLPLNILLFWCCIGPTFAGMISIGTTPPTVNDADIAQLAGGSDAGGDQGHIWSNRPHQGQSFTTAADSSGYLLKAVNC